jgi:hypothetical protein
MNNAAVNASNLNGPADTGHNAVLSGGIACASLVSSALITGAILTGGLFSVSDAQGRVAAQLRGGTVAAVGMGGKLFMTANLQQGIHSSYTLDSLPLSFDPALKSGIKCPSEVGGQLVTHVLLQTPQLGKHTQLGGTIKANTTVNGGVCSTAYVGGGIRGSTVLVSDGVKATCQVGSNAMKLGRALSGGLVSGNTVGGSLKYPAYLRGGILGTWELGKELDCEARLQHGILSICDMGGGLLISPVGNGGIQTSWTFGAGQLLSPAANGGVGKDPSMGAGFKITAKLQQGISSNCVLGGKGITASQVLRDGVTVAAPILGGQLKSQALLQGGIAASGTLHGEMVQGFQDPLLNTWALEIRSATVLLDIKHPTSDI